jgi:exodeoxyribonuclease-5
MLKNYISTVISRNIPFAFTSDQKELADAFADFVFMQNSRDVLLVKGYAGTGKTSMIRCFLHTLHELKYKVVLLAPTGRAAKVLSNISEWKATTIHKHIYIQKTSKDAFGEFKLNRNLDKDTFFIVDEVSMLTDQNIDASIFGSGNLLDDLIRFVYNERNCKLILVGDAAQLPPVGLPLSKAMDKVHLENFGLKVKVTELKEVVRQDSKSGILANATDIRKFIELNDVQRPSFRIKGYKDICSIRGNEVLENISDAYSRYGMEETIIICRSNKTANKYNQAIRSRILFREEEISTGDNLMVVKNNYYWLSDSEVTPFLANGDIVKVKRVKKIQEVFGFRFIDTDLVLPDYNNLEISAKLLLDTIYSETPSLSAEENKKLFYTIADEEYGNIEPTKKRNAMVKENSYFNALQIKFGYAITCHKSQGGQWKAVFIDQSYFNDEMLTSEYLKWLYTAITRATEKVYLVNFDERFFE